MLVLMATGLGILIGVGVTGAITLARAIGRRQAEEMRPEIPKVAISILNEVDTFAVILDASLSPVFINAAAKDEQRAIGAELTDPGFLRRARQVMLTGASDTQMPDAEDRRNSLRLHIFRVQKQFLVVLADDLGEEQRVNAMRRDFIANVSHELKTPIAAIGLLAEAVREASDDPLMVRDFSKTMMKEAKRLGNLSRDIIKLSEAQSSLDADAREAVDLRSVVHSEVEAHRTLAAQRGIDLVVTDPAERDQPAVILGRASALGTALANLISNAIRHSTQGSHVGIGMEFDRETLVVTVTDQGEGIESEHLPRLFERFYRIDASRTRDPSSNEEDGGTGLGLSIARHTMRAHGGDIEVWSQPGVGSSFSLIFPLSDVSSQGKKKSKNEKKKKKDSKKSAGGKTKLVAGTPAPLRNTNS